MGFIWSGIGSGLYMEWDRQWALYGVGIGSGLYMEWDRQWALYGVG